MKPTYWFIFDRRKQFTEYEASFLDEVEARKYAESTLGEFAHVTSDLNRTLVVPRGGVGMGYLPRRR